VEEGKISGFDASLWGLPILPASYLPIPNPATDGAAQRESTTGFGITYHGNVVATPHQNEAERF
jgi:hypothetical protein